MIEEHKPTRRNRQNAFLRGRVLPILVGDVSEPVYEESVVQAREQSEDVGTLLSFTINDLPYFHLTDFGRSTEININPFYFNDRYTTRDFFAKKS